MSKMWGAVFGWNKNFTDNLICIGCYLIQRLDHSSNDLIQWPESDHGSDHSKTLNGWSTENSLLKILYYCLFIVRFYFLVLLWKEFNLHYFLNIGMYYVTEINQLNFLKFTLWVFLDYIIMKMIQIMIHPSNFSVIDPWQDPWFDPEHGSGHCPFFINIFKVITFPCFYFLYSKFKTQEFAKFNQIGNLKK